MELWAKEKEHLSQIIKKTAEMFETPVPEIRFKNVKSGHWRKNWKTERESITLPNWLFTQTKVMQEHMALHEISHAIANRQGAILHDSCFQKIEARTHVIWDLWLGTRKRAYVNYVMKNGIQYTYDWRIARTVYG